MWEYFSGKAEQRELSVALRKLQAVESKLGRILIETAILLSMHNQTDTARVLRDAAQAYKVDVDAISAQVKWEFASKARSKATQEDAPKPKTKAKNKVAA